MVAARTYALYHLGGGLYDVDDTTASQVYGGVGRETQSQNAAIAATHLQGVFYGGRIIGAPFSSRGRGPTQPPRAEGGGSNTPPLAAGLANYGGGPLPTTYTPPPPLGRVHGH